MSQSLAVFGRLHGISDRWYSMLLARGVHDVDEVEHRD